MADTINDIDVPTGDWVSAYALTSIAVGVAITVQAKGDYLLSQVKATKPSASDTNGVVLVPFEHYDIPTGASGLWLRAVNFQTKANVQES